MDNKKAIWKRIAFLFEYMWLSISQNILLFLAIFAFANYITPWLVGHASSHEPWPHEP
jgi:hypothetical protein